MYQARPKSRLAVIISISRSRHWSLDSHLISMSAAGLSSFRTLWLRPAVLSISGCLLAALKASSLLCWVPKISTYHPTPKIYAMGQTVTENEVYSNLGLELSCRLLHGGAPIRSPANDLLGPHRPACTVLSINERLMLGVGHTHKVPKNNLYTSLFIHTTDEHSYLIALLLPKLTSYWTKAINIFSPAYSQS